jgi:hypothetical protein
MSDPEKIIHDLEIKFPAMSGQVFHDARAQALASGQSVWESDNGVIYEVFPDGRRVERKRIEPPIHIPVGTTAVIR